MLDELNDNLKRDVAKVILDYLKEQWGNDYFKAYYEGDPLDIPQSMLPCIIVETRDGDTNYGATSQDANLEQIAIKVVLNKKEDFGASDNDDLTHKKLKAIVRGRDATTGEYKSTSIFGLLRPKVSFDGFVLDQNMTYSYVIAPRQEGTITAEAEVVVTVEETIDLTTE